MNAFDKVHEYGEGGAGQNGALKPAASQRPRPCHGFQVWHEVYVNSRPARASSDRTRKLWQLAKCIYLVSLNLLPKRLSMP